MVENVGFESYRLQPQSTGASSLPFRVSVRQHSLIKHDITVPIKALINGHVLLSEQKEKRHRYLSLC